MNKKELHKLIKEVLSEGWFDRLKAKTGSVGSFDQESAKAQSRIQGLKKMMPKLLDYLMDTERLLPQDSPKRQELSKIESTVQNLIGYIDDFSGGDMGGYEPEQSPETTSEPDQPSDSPPVARPRSGNRVGSDREATRRSSGIGSKPRSGNRVKSSGVPQSGRRDFEASPKAELPQDGTPPDSAPVPKSEPAVVPSTKPKPKAQSRSKAAAKPKAPPKPKAKPKVEPKSEPAAAPEKKKSKAKATLENYLKSFQKK